jgi:uncharacterized membrane protein
MDTPSTTPSPVVSSEDKTVAIVAYITIIGFIAAIIIHSNKKTQLGAFHLRQMLGIILTGVAAMVCAIVPILGWIVYIVAVLALLVFWIMGLIAAIQGQTKPVPILGAKYQQWFAGAFN